MFADNSETELTFPDRQPTRLEKLERRRRALAHTVSNGAARSGNDWVDAPLTFTPASSLTTKQMKDRVNKYFSDLYLSQELPLLNGFAGAVGFDSFPQLISYAMNGDLMQRRIIARALLAIATAYEREFLAGNRAALALLERIPHFDPELINQAPSRPFQNDDLVVVSKPDEAKTAALADLAPIDAYLNLIRSRSFTPQKSIAKLQRRKING